MLSLKGALRSRSLGFHDIFSVVPQYLSRRIVKERVARCDTGKTVDLSHWETEVQ